MHQYPAEEEKCYLERYLGNPNQNVLHLSLEKGNFCVALRLWEMQLQYYCEDGVKDRFSIGWDIKYATLLGEAAINSYSL